MAKATAHPGSLRSSALVALAVVSSQIGFASEAGAADPKFQGVGEVRLGFTDNVQQAPDVPIPGSAPKSAGLTTYVSPGLVVAFASRRHIQRLTYTFSYDLVFGPTTLSRASNQLGYRALFDLSPSWDLVVGASAIQSNSSSAILIAPPGAGAIDAVPTGTGSFLVGTADELLSFSPAIGVRAYQNATVSEQTPIFDTVAPRTFAVGGRLGIERSWEGDAIAAEPRVDYAAITGSLRPDGTPAGEQRQVTAGGVGIWRHDWGRSFASRAEAGALRAQRLNTDSGMWEPIGTAAFAYVTEFGDAEVSYDHALTTNLLLGQFFLVDEARLRGGVPLTKKGEILVGGTTGYQRGRILDENLDEAANVNLILLDVGVGWQTTQSLLLGIRYQHVDQMSDVRTPPLPVSFTRNSIMVGAILRYPPDSEMPRGYRAPQRVDRSDEIRDTTEPSAPGGSRGGTGT
jgi:hypothetical protein